MAYNASAIALSHRLSGNFGHHANVSRLRLSQLSDGVAQPLPGCYDRLGVAY
jgi:hypothetical protein